MRAILVVVGLAIVGQTVSAQAPDKKELPQPLPDVVLEAWKDAKAQVWWLHVTTDRVYPTPEPGTIPHFVTPVLSPEGIAKLPFPETPFGFALVGSTSEELDDRLKEIARFKSLVFLTLTRKRVSDEGLKELVVLKNLTHLGLKTDMNFRNRVSDEGMKSVSALKNLVVLDLEGTGVRTAGLKELTQLKNLAQLNLNFTGEVTEEGVKHLDVRF